MRPRLARAERKRARRQADIERAQALYNSHIDELRLAWLATHFERQNARCAYCGITMLMRTLNRKDPQRATLDHLRARSKGGVDSLKNTAAACQACNSSKGDMDAACFRKLRRGSAA